MHVKDEVVGATIDVGDGKESSGRSVTDVGAGVCPVVAGQQDEVGCCAGLTDGGHGSLNGGSPGGDGSKIVGLVHDAEGDLGLGGVFGSQLRPERGELRVCGTALSDDGAVPARVVVDVNDA